jgi:Excalibur calcium-binding domain
MRLLVCLALVALASMATVLAPISAAKTPAVYKNCTNLNKKYPHGLGRGNARDITKSDEPVTNFKRNTRLYRKAMSHNRRLDRDKDGIACEKK